MMTLDSVRVPTIQGITSQISSSSHASKLNTLASTYDEAQQNNPAENGFVRMDEAIVKPETHSLAPVVENNTSEREDAAAVGQSRPLEKQEINGPPSSPAEMPKVTFEDYLSFHELSFEWADSYDTKDFDRLSRILAPELNIDYSIVAPPLPKVEKMPAQAFLDFVSSPHFLGDPLIRTQHLLGASKFVKEDDDHASARIQIRAAHQREDTGGKAEFNGHGHALLHHSYRRIDGQWLLAGVKPVVYWNEGSFEQIFRGPAE